MKKFLITFCTLLIGLSANAAVTADQALTFFAKYIDSANNYKEDVVNFYTPDAKIIRVVMKLDGSTVTLTTNMKEYANQMRIGANLAKMRGYKNFYTERKVTKSGNDYKITCLRQPSTSDYKIPAYFIIGEDSKGELKIKEESMHSKNQLLLKGKKK